MKRLLKLLTFFIQLIITVSCAKDIVDLTGNIQGVVLDYSDGRTLSNCRISITPSGLSTVSSADGSFEFNHIEPNDYTLIFDKSGYTEQIEKISVIANKTVELAITMRAKSPFSISDDNVDFGDLESNKNIYFYNNSDSDCSYKITNIPSWLSITRTNGSISGSSSESIGLTVNRASVNYGKFSQIISISYSGKSSGTKNISISFEKVQLTTPAVSCQSPITIEQTKATIKGNILATGGSKITEYGHCWSTSTSPTINDNVTKLGSTEGLQEFTSSLVGLQPGTHYYVRAYATNQMGTSYSDVISFKTNTTGGKDSEPEFYGRKYYMKKIKEYRSEDWQTHTVIEFDLYVQVQENGSGIQEAGFVVGLDYYKSEPTINNNHYQFTTLMQNGAIHIVEQVDRERWSQPCAYVRPYIVTNTGVVYGDAEYVSPGLPRE